MGKQRIPPEERSRELQYYYDHKAERDAYRAAYAKTHPRSKEYEAYRVRKYRLMHPEKAEARRAYQREYYRKRKAARAAISNGEMEGTNDPL